MASRPSKTPDVQKPLEKRFKATFYKASDCELAIQGRHIPQGLGHNVNQACVVRGIRFHHGYATELLGTLPNFTRALHARQIMSNIIPDINKPEDFPYCIWHPVVAEESTYRKLCQRYPEMKYQIGRACAVAGYTELYRELDLLPDIHIAEEARDNGSLVIYEDIMGHREKFSMMNDYTRSTNAASASLNFPYLNGDTAVRSSLDTKRRYSGEAISDSMSNDYFNITEDFGIDLVDSVPGAVIAAKQLAVQYLYTPLPVHLPALQKDILILLAAYHGDVDRYSRLRRPRIMLPKELRCVIRGIYHNPFFAKWWSVQFHNGAEDPQRSSKIITAVNARAIMSNDVSKITSTTLAQHIPYFIWYPSIPHPSTIELLFKRWPNMKPQLARACIVANYKEQYDKLNPDPDTGLLAEAKASLNPHYLEDLNIKVDTTGINERSDIEGLKRYTRTDAFEPSSITLCKLVGPENVVTGFDWLYEGTNANISNIELHVSVEPIITKDGTANTGSGLPAPVDEDLAQDGVSFLDFRYGEEARRIDDDALLESALQPT